MKFQYIGWDASGQRRVAGRFGGLAFRDFHEARSKPQGDSQLRTNLRRSSGRSWKSASHLTATASQVPVHRPLGKSAGNLRYPPAERLSACEASPLAELRFDFE